MNIQRAWRIGAILGAGLLIRAAVQGSAPIAAKNIAVESPSSGIRDTLLVLDQEYWEAASKHDVQTLGRLFADDFVGITSDGTRWNKAMLLDQHRRRSVADLKRIGEREVIRLGEHAALLTYEAKFSVFNESGRRTDRADQRLTSCWVQRDGGWFVAFSQTADVVSPRLQVKPTGPAVDGNPTPDQSHVVPLPGGQIPVRFRNEQF